MQTKITRVTKKISSSKVGCSKDSFLKHIDLVDQLIIKETAQLSDQLGIENEELQAWIGEEALKQLVPSKTILHLLRKARQHQLDPLQEEIALIQYEDGWQVFISVDGWIKIINRHPAFNGMCFTESPNNSQELPVWIECTIYRSDRAIPTTIREHLIEAQNASEIWKKMPRRMLRHKALQQCARLAMGIAFIEPREALNHINSEKEIHQKASSICDDAPIQITQAAKLKKLLGNEEF